jgi:hypothetical protein
MIAELRGGVDVNATKRKAVSSELSCMGMEGDKLVLHYGIDPIKERILLHEEEGWLKCEAQDCDGKTWCIHIEKAVSEHFDADLWATTFSEAEYRNVHVPIVPSRNQWATVELSSEDAPPGSMKAFWMPTHSLSSNDQALGEFIGFVHRGEGRQVLRTTLYDNLRAQIASGTLRCANKTHSYAAQMAWEKATTEDTKGGVAEYWSVYDTHMCITCASSSPDDFADLIPDPGGRKWR